jgi:hypothetical protein
VFARRFHIAVLAALSLLAGAQALAPAHAAAADDNGGCFAIVNGSLVFVNDCEGVAQPILVFGAKPGEKQTEPPKKQEPIRQPSGPGFDGSGGRDSNSRGLGGRGGGGGGNSGAVSPNPPKDRYLLETCKKYERNIRKYLSDEDAFSRDEIKGFWSWLTGGGNIQTAQYKASKAAWKRDGCPGPVPTGSD